LIIRGERPGPPAVDGAGVLFQSVKCHKEL
jgi:hypothetical protein